MRDTVHDELRTADLKAVRRVPLRLRVRPEVAAAIP